MLLQEYNGTSLAYMGDAVMSLFVREMLLSKGYQKPNVLQKKSVEWVSAKAQARFLEVLETEGFLQRRNGESFFAEEIRIQKRKRKIADVITYRKSTGLEANLWLAVFKTGL